MLNDLVPLTLTVEEGNNLLKIASGFALPEALGEGQKFTNSDRVLANMEVAVFYQALRERSPLLRSKKRLLFFGPVEAYEEFKDPVSGRTGRRVLDPDAEVKLHLDGMQVRGLVWCLLASLDPTSWAVAGAGDQVSLVWTVARKIGYVEHLREQIGLDKAQPKVIRPDREPKKDGNGSGAAAPAVETAPPAPVAVAPGGELR